MPSRGQGVEIVGLRDLMRDLRKLGDKDGPREIRRELREAVVPIAADARRRAPRSTRDRSGWRDRKHLADTIRPFVRGDVIGIRATRSGARVIHEGGRRPADTRNRDTWVQVPRRPFISDAVEAAANRIVDDLGDALERAARRNGWR